MQTQIREIKTKGEYKYYLNDNLIGSIRFKPWLLYSATIKINNTEFISKKILYFIKITSKLSNEEFLFNDSQAFLNPKIFGMAGEGSVIDSNGEKYKYHIPTIPIISWNRFIWQNQGNKEKIKFTYKSNIWSIYSDKESIVGKESLLMFGFFLNLCKKRSSRTILIVLLVAILTNIIIF